MAHNIYHHTYPGEGIMTNNVALPMGQNVLCK